MPAVTRYQDMSTGHGTFPPRPNKEASSDVFINNLGVHRLGDDWDKHKSGSSEHNGTLASASSNVFVNGIPVGRVGDDISCGDVVAQGSPNVFAN